MYRSRLSFEKMAGIQDTTPVNLALTLSTRGKNLKQCRKRIRVGSG